VAYDYHTRVLEGFAMQLSSSVKAALAIFALVLLYFGVRTIFNGGRDDAEAVISSNVPFAVLAETISPQEWRDEITIRGRTEALRKVTVRAETSGVVAETPARQGADVEAGDVLCRIKVDARQAALNEARASLSKARLDYNGAVKLAKEGFRSETSVASIKAAFDLAKANVEQAELNLKKTNISAPFRGIYDKRMVEAGDFMNIGDPCGVVIQQSPFLVTGAISERDISKITAGDAGTARLSTGEIIDGSVRFVASSADPATRTFEVELEIPNEKGTLKDGVTAEFTVFAAERNAHLIPRVTLVLDDNGRIAVRTVDSENKVKTTLISLLGENVDGVWVQGLEGNVSLITRGQDFVTDGQTVVMADQSKSPNTGSETAR